MPVVVLEATLLNAITRNSGLPPQGDGLLIALQGGHPDLVGPKAETTVGDLCGDQFPGVVDGAFLEVITEREIPHHLEERAVPGGLAHVVYVQGANTLLNRGCSAVGGGLLPHEIGFEGNHPGIDEQQCGVVVKERRARHDGVVVAREEIDESAPDFGGFHWRFFLEVDVSQGFWGMSSSARSSASFSRMAAVKVSRKSLNLLTACCPDASTRSATPFGVN